jgi:hypothetical protein
MTWDLFISHASEDKAEVARPLADMLQAKGYKVWYDEYSLTLGDNLRQSIEKGLAQSRFAVIVLSPSFFAKKWTNLELDGLIILERPGVKSILPVWHNVNASDVERYSPSLGMKQGVSTHAGLNRVVDKICHAVERECNSSSLEDNGAKLEIHPHSVALLLAAQASNGTIMTIQTYAGFLVLSGEKNFGAHGDPRTDALNMHCLNEIVSLGMAEKLSDSMFELTQEGFDFLPPSELHEPVPQFPSISANNFEMAKEILNEAIAGDGTILMVTTNGSGHRAGMQNDDSALALRKESRRKSVLKELMMLGLVTQASSRVYFISHLGYLWIDKLNMRANQEGL